MTELIRTEDGWKTPDGRLKISAARTDEAIKLTLEGLTRDDVMRVLMLVGKRADG